MMDVARALLGVLFAGLWQGPLIAVLAAAALAGLRSASASTRHAVLWCALLAIAVIPLVTTMSSEPATPNALFPIAHATVSNTILPTGSTGIAQSSAPHEIRVDLLNEAALVLCALWLIGVIWRLSVAVGGGLRVAQIRRNCSSAGSRDGIAVYVSDDVSVPISMGFAHPAIIVPKVLFDSLTSESMECVVQHEIAHVLRRDVWTKGAQLLIEALLWYNPAVLFIGRKIAFEREAACDDRALARISDVRRYADCLACVASLVSQARVSPGVALGFGNTTVSRVRRLMGSQRNGRVSISSLTVGGSVMVLAAIAFVFQALAPVVAFSGTPQQAPLIAHVVSLAHPIEVVLAGSPQTATLGATKVHLAASPVRITLATAPKTVSGVPIPKTVTGAPIEVALNCNALAGAANPVIPPYPVELEASKSPVYVVATIDLDARGNLTEARITHSSGYSSADQATLRAVRNTVFHPAYRDCKATAGEYTYRVDFPVFAAK